MGLGGDQNFGQSDIILLDTENIFTSCFRLMVKQNTNTATDENLSIKTVACSADTHLLLYTWLDPELGLYIMLHGIPFHDEVYVNTRVRYQTPYTISINRSISCVHIID